MTDIVIAACIRQEPETLKLFLESIQALEPRAIVLVDDNDSEESQGVLHSAANMSAITTLLGLGDLGIYNGPKPRYEVTETTHIWSLDADYRLAQIRDALMSYLSRHFYHVPYTFMVDSDIICPPDTFQLVELPPTGTIKHLLHWTKGDVDAPWMPSAWDMHKYRFLSPARIFQLLEPGIFRYAGIAGNFIAQTENLRRLSYRAIAGCPYDWGQDRHFSVTAAVAGYRILVDTHRYPFHVYTRDQLPLATQWYNSGCSRDVITYPLDHDWRRAIRGMFEPGGSA